ncbi:glycosyltransferase [Mangrovibacterium marinum]|uniref:Glycosyltransferase involved in cell wall biosynthesis n=1 Tax=Mangrovibacterium marinum TaxID=1639118 RepID=A0A2T5C6B2_9BACT|nr:glycosyltransferase [Mangrovibacterium marinum]PTN10493.1 glycosyltransferase involved in cell wall biosynthesis [Mangrovibacterium marinum]
MKIVLIGAAHPYRGGLASYNERLAKELQKQGHDVHICTFTVQYPSFLFPGKTQYSAEPAPEGLSIERCVNSVNPINWMTVGRRIAKMEPDLVLVKYWLPLMGPCFGTILRQIRRRSRAKIITIVDNMIPHEPRPGDIPFTRYFARAVDGFVAMSKTVLADIDQFDQTKARMLSPHPIFDNFGAAEAREKALEQLKLDPHYRYVLFFGLIRGYKGLDLALEAFRDQRLKERGIRLIVAGEHYGDRKVYDEIIARYALSDLIVEFPRFIQDSEVTHFFSAADLVVQPYKSATQSGVTQIAYHFNKPMVVTNVGGLPEMCPHGRVGYVVETNAGEIANAIVQFFEQGKGPEMAANIRDEKKRYSWAILAENILKLTQTIQK